MWRAAAAIAACSFPFHGGCDNERETDDAPASFGIYHDQPRPPCTETIAAGRQPVALPQVVAADWGEPIKLGVPINTACPEDAVSISADGAILYFYWSPAVGADPAELLRGTTGTYYAERLGADPGRFGEPRFLDLRQGAREGACDGAVSFSPAGDVVYFHSTRWENLGYQASPAHDDYLDIYAAPIVGGAAGVATNLGPPVNSVFRDGEHGLSPCGTRLYLSSDRPGGVGGVDIWVSTFAQGVWGEPVNLGRPVNSAGSDMQPAFAANDPLTLYFATERAGAMGIFRSRFQSEGRTWSEPEPVVIGHVGEPALVADGSVMYFVHVLVDAAGVFGADIWYVERR